MSARSEGVIKMGVSDWFDWVGDLFGDLEDMNVGALGLTLLISGIFGIFFFLDPLKTGMSDLSIVYRLIGWGLGSVVSYVVADKMLNK